VLPDRLHRYLLAFALSGLLCAPPASAEDVSAPAPPGSDALASTELHDEPSPESGAKKGRDDDEPKRVVTQKAGRLLVKATDLFGEERFEEAEKVLAKLRRMNPYEEALANRMKAYLAFAREDTDAAIAHLQAALEDDVLPVVDHADVLFQIARLQATRQDWHGVATTMKKWFALVEDPNTAAYHLLALAYYQMGDLRSALAPAQQAVAVAEKPHQAAIQLLLAIRLTRKDYRDATPVLIDLLTHYPSSGSGYWLQLVSLYGVQGDLEHALAVLQLAHQQGMVSEDSDFRRLAQLLLHQGIPHRAARLVEEALAAKTVREDAEAYELLSSGWIMARETTKAEGPLARAAELADKGDLYIRLAQIHLLQEEWSQAADALRRALRKGGLEDPGTAELLLGVAYFNSNEFLEARSWFGRAHQSAKTRDQAETWLQHVQREIEVHHGGAQTAG
jgi:tetratricopeptide (TPR) repeat protein